MHARARLAAAAGGGAPGTTRITDLRSDPPLVLRPTRTGPTAGLDRFGISPQAALTVALTAGAAGPLGGDHLRLDVEVGPGATLVVRGVAASVVLPGPHGAPSRTEIDLRVAAGATLVWLPGVTIATRRCDHHASTVVTLDAGARFLGRDELILGRHGETAGSLLQSWRVTVSGRPLVHHDLRVGPGAPGWDGPAVTGGRRAVGSVVVVDPRWAEAQGEDRAEDRGEDRGEARREAGREAGSDSLPPDTARLQLNGPGMIVAAAAGEAHTLRHRLDAALSSRDDGAGPGGRRAG